MGAKAKKAMKKQLSKAVSASAQKPVASSATAAPDFLPLEGGPARKLPEEKPKEEVARVVYISRIPHGFYEKEMQGFFGQFGVIKRLRIVRNRKTGKSKHFGFIEFEDPGVAKIVAETMDNYLLFEHLLQTRLIPPEKVHPKLWKGCNIRAKPLNWVQIERKRHDKERTLEEHKKLVEKIKKRDLKRQKRIEAAGIEYECPDIVTNDQPAPKKKKLRLK
ncbi:putative RNA-binding protein C1827.05c [Rosa sericea]